MESVFITELHINRVRHLNNISVSLSTDSRKHLIFTGKNGSGKTSVLKAIASRLEHIVNSSYSIETCESNIAHYQDQLAGEPNTENERLSRLEHEKNLEIWQGELAKWKDGVTIESTSISRLVEKYTRGKFILAYYGDDRKMEVLTSDHIEKVELKPVYSLNDKPSCELAKYLVNLKTTQAFAQTSHNDERAAQIEEWFQRFEAVLRRIYNDDSLRLEFDIESFQFSIHVKGREPFDFNTMSMGYAAVFDIIGDLIMRMESNKQYDLEGVVLIDEIETHLHVELQKEILPILSNLFPNLQFILTTHSPFVLNSAMNSVVYDLEKHILRLS